MSSNDKVQNPYVAPNGTSPDADLSITCAPLSEGKPFQLPNYLWPSRCCSWQ